MIYIHKTFLVKVLFITGEFYSLQVNIIYQSEIVCMPELTSAIKMKLLELTSVVMATIRDVQKKIETKFKTLKLLEKDTPRIWT